MLRGSPVFRPIFPSAGDRHEHRSPARARVRFSTPSWWSVVAFGALIAGSVYWTQDTTRNARAADRTRLGEHPATVESIAFDPSGRWVASAARDGSVYLWDVNGRELDIALEQASTARGGVRVLPGIHARWLEPGRGE